MWQWPAVLSAAVTRQCKRVVQETVAALDLQNGVFGLQAIIALLSGVVLLMTFIYIFSSFLSAGGKKKKKGASGSVMKVEDGKEVRRSTR